MLGRARSPGKRSFPRFPARIYGALVDRYCLHTRLETRESVCHVRRTTTSTRRRCRSAEPDVTSWAGEMIDSLTGVSWLQYCFARTPLQKNIPPKSKRNPCIGGLVAGTGTPRAWPPRRTRSAISHCRASATRVPTLHHAHDHVLRAPTGRTAHPITQTAAARLMHSASQQPSAPLPLPLVCAGL